MLPLLFALPDHRPSILDIRFAEEKIAAPQPRTLAGSFENLVCLQGRRAIRFPVVYARDREFSTDALEIFQNSRNVLSRFG